MTWKSIKHDKLIFDMNFLDILIRIQPNTPKNTHTHTPITFAVHTCITQTRKLLLLTFLLSLLIISFYKQRTYHTNHTIQSLCVYNELKCVFKSKQT